MEITRERDAQLTTESYDCFSEQLVHSSTLTL